MHFVIRHYINDRMKWDRSQKNILNLFEQQQLPAGLKPLEYLPSVDGRKADCVWEAESLWELRKFIDRETLGAARNEYFEVQDEAAIGFPKAVEPVEAYDC
jgi:hypothetical protein